MQIRELSKPITAKTLNESLAKTFGYRINLEQFTDVQLEDARNKLRTKMSQLELGESFDTVTESPEYQKTRMFLDTINQEITERAEGKCEQCHKDPCECEEEEEEGVEDKKSMHKKVQAEKLKEKAEEYSVPESWIDSAIQRMELGESDEEELTSELTTRYDLSEDQANYIVYLAEGEAEKAATIMATKDMVERITGWIEDVANLRAEKLLELLDSIRENQGSDVAQKYEQAVKPSLDSIYSSLESSRQGLSTALALVSGGEVPTMGAEPGMDQIGDMGGEMPPMPEPETSPEGEELPELPGGDAGREKRESVDYSRRLGILLAASKKK
jgi:hypothetical protein